MPAKPPATRKGLLVRADLPRLDKYLPEPFSPEDDVKLDRQLRNINDMYSNGILLLRATGMCVGEGLNLTIDAMRDFGPNQCSIKIPLGKLHTERWVPIDEDGYDIFEHILLLRSLIIRRHPEANSEKLLLKKNGRLVTYHLMRTRLIAAARHLLEMFRRGIGSKETERKLARLINRLDKISAEVSKFVQAEK